MNPLAILGAASTALSPFVSVLGSLWQKRAVEKTNEANVLMNEATNKANLDIASATNAANLAMADKANDLQWRMMQNQQQFNAAQSEKERQYNTAQAQVQRMLAAGLNPHAVDNAGTFTPAQASMATAHVGHPAVSPIMQAAHVQPAYVDMSNVVSSLQNLGSLAHEISDANVKNKIAQQAADTQRDLVDSQVKKLNTETQMQEWQNAHVDEKWKHELHMDDQQVDYWMKSIANDSRKVDAMFEQIASNESIARNHESAETNRMILQLDAQLRNLFTSLEHDAEQRGLDRDIQQKMLQLAADEFYAKHGGIINETLDYIGLHDLGSALIGIGMLKGFGGMRSGKVGKPSQFYEIRDGRWFQINGKKAIPVPPNSPKLDNIIIRSNGMYYRGVRDKSGKMRWSQYE